MDVDHAVLRPGPGWVGQWFMDRALAALPFVFGVLRDHWPVLRLGKTYLVTRHDDVRAIFADDEAFGVPYKAKLDVILAKEPFVLGMSDGAEYRAGIAALRRVVRLSDVPALADRVEAMAAAIVQESDGEVEVVDMIRRISFDFLADYLGVPQPEGADLKRWGTRLFEYQFVADDDALRAEVGEIAPALRDHVQRAIDRRQAAPEARDDVLARCLALKASGAPEFDDAQIRTALIGLIVGGPPQPPMVVPQAMEQLLRRPAALAAAQAAARAGDDHQLAAHVTEAMRFDPLAPWMPRVALAARTIGKGRNARVIPQDAKVLASIASAMRDERRVPDPRRFDATRGADQYLHFGWGIHQCFGLEINRATLHRMIKPLLTRANLRRAPGRAGRLRKRGAFASSLTVRFD